jgi:hypothetical protein
MDIFSLCLMKPISCAGQRVLHIVTYCLNYLFLGRHPTLDEIGRRPNKWHLRCFQRLRSLLVVCGEIGQDAIQSLPKFRRLCHTADCFPLLNAANIARS